MTDRTDHPAYYWQWGTPYVARFCVESDAEQFLVNGEEQDDPVSFPSISRLSAVGTEPQSGVEYRDQGHAYCMGGNCPDDSEDAP